MTRIENTRNRGPLEHLVGMTDDPTGYITGMEADGQRQLIRSAQLPIEGPWDQLKALGFVQGKKVDDLFCEATLPVGWTKEASDHPMSSHLLDERGVRRVNVFYKAAFYDRRADMHMVDPGHNASIEVLYGDGPVELPAQWDVFTHAERDSFIDGLTVMAEQIADSPTIYGKYADRLAAARKLVAGPA